MRSLPSIAAALVCCAMLAACSQSTSPSALPTQAGSLDRSLASASYQTLYGFKGQPDGESPNADLIVANGVIYGTTVAGGSANFGTIFKLTTAGNEQPVFSFLAGTGSNSPNEGVIEANGTFFGTTDTAMYAVTKSGTERILHALAGGADGYGAQGPLVFAAGKLYGATQLGGMNACNSGCGTLFNVTPAGAYKVFYDFHGGHDGQVPTGSLINVKGTLYGTTSYGGTHDAGTIFKITPSGNKTVLYDFAGADDGSGPSGNLLFAGGTLYGTARYNGVKAQGTVFALTLKTGKFALLHGFTNGAKDGGSPNGGLVMNNGIIYGTTVIGGPGDKGTIFSVTRAGKEALIYAFKGGTDGNTPQAGLLNINGTLYGTTLHGGKSDEGTVFKIRP